MRLSSLERKLLKEKKAVIGIDEAGRGALAGPLFIAGIILNQEILEKLKKQVALKKIKDSKQLTSLQRETIFNYLKELKILKYTYITPQKMDKIGLSKSIEEAIKKLVRKFENKDIVLLDGGLSFKNKSIPSKTIIKGDQKILSIALASIGAKVLRDRHMKKLSRLFPEYGFEIHKGYGVKLHLKALKKHGKSKIHRMSYKPVFRFSSFKERVYYIVSKIPKGQTLSYKEVAYLAGSPKAWRAVGNILNKNKDKNIPCHRVIRSNGKLGGYNKGQKLKREILKKEGINL